MHEHHTWDGTLPGAETKRGAPLEDVLQAENQERELVHLQDRFTRTQVEIAHDEELLRTCGDTLSPQQVTELTNHRDACTAMLATIQQDIEERLNEVPGTTTIESPHQMQ